jgi:hypothetical protein
MKKTFSVKVIIEHVHKNKMFHQLIKDITKSKNTNIGKLFADGVYDDNKIFVGFSDKGIILLSK